MTVQQSEAPLLLEARGFSQENRTAFQAMYLTVASKQSLPGMIKCPVERRVTFPFDLESCAANRMQASNSMQKFSRYQDTGPTPQLRSASIFSHSGQRLCRKLFVAVERLYLYPRDSQFSQSSRAAYVNSVAALGIVLLVYIGGVSAVSGQLGQFGEVSRGVFMGLGGLY